MVFTYVNPAVAVAAGVLVLAEPFTTSIVVGFVLIMAGSLLATAAALRARPDARERPGAPTAPRG